MSIILRILPLLFVGQLALADCEAVPWPFNHDMKRVQVMELNSQPREHLYKYLYFELSVPVATRIPGLAEKLFYYLQNTEVSDGRFHLLKVLESTSLEQKSNVIPVEQLCKLDAKVDRSPASKAKAKKAVKAPTARKKK